MNIEQSIREIINGFAEKGIVFSNEQDFQFEMALAFKNGKYGVKNVKLETISLNNSSTWESVKDKVAKKEKLSSKIKQYHDILIELNNGECILLELKYKTPGKLCFYETSQGQMITFIQGAYDIGAYDFLEDISRLEEVKNRNFVNDIQRKIVKSYAVLLTNDKNYRFNDFSKGKKGKQSPWENYSIMEGKEFHSGKIPFICADPNRYVTPKGKRFNAINLKHNYKPFQWENYELEGYKDFKNANGRSVCPGFSFLIVEVKLD